MLIIKLYVKVLKGGSILLRGILSEFAFDIFFLKLT